MRTIMLVAATLMLTLSSMPRASEGPTPEEVLILEYMNRFRADPTAEADLILEKGVRPNLDKAKFRSEVVQLPPVNPLVFNMQLVDACRKHSQYMIYNQMTHNQKPGNQGFVAVHFHERAKLSGYPGPRAENCFRDASDAWGSHVGFVVDYGTDPDGMQNPRGHRLSMANGDYREVGVSAVPHSGRISVTHLFGVRNNVRRLAGGVVYMDLNGNQFYDIGEGVGGVKIEVEGGGASVHTWESGAYTLELPSTNEVTLVATKDGMTMRKTFPAGSGNIKFDWIIPPAELIARVKKRVEDLEAIPEDPANERRRRSALIDLYFSRAGASADSELAEKVEALIAPVAADVEASLAEMRTAIESGDPQLITRTANSGRGAFAGTAMADWYADALLYARHLTAFQRLQNQKDQGRTVGTQHIQGLLRNLERGESQYKTDEFRQRLGALKAAAGRL